MTPMLADYQWLEPEFFARWRFRVVAEGIARNLTAARRIALIGLIDAISLGNPNPTDQQVSDATGISARTVRRARGDAHSLGLLSWTRTRQLMHDGRWRQGPNEYALNCPVTPVCSDGQNVHASKKSISQERLGKGPTRSARQQLQVLGFDPDDAQAARLSLAAIAARRTGLLQGSRHLAA